MKKLFILIALTAVAFGIAACSKNASSPVGEPSQPGINLPSDGKDSDDDSFDFSETGENELPLQPLE